MASSLLSPAFYSTFDTSEADMSTRSQHSLEDVPEDSPIPMPSPALRTRKAPSIRTLGSRSTSSPTLPKERSRTLHRVKSSPKLPHDVDAEPAPSTALYWSKAPVFGTMPVRIMRSHTVTLIDSTAWLFGGCDDKDCGRDVFCFDTETMQWTRPDTNGEMPPPSRAHTATAVDRRIVVYGGGQGSTYYDSVYVFDTVLRRWSQPTIAGPKPPPRRAHTAVYYKGKIYMFGGGNGMTALNDVWTLDVSSIGTGKLRWEELQTTGRKPSHRGYHTANLVTNIMIVIGGSDGKDCFNDMWYLNLGEFPSFLAGFLSSPSDTLRWSKLFLERPHRRLSHTSTLVGSYLFIIGGHDGTNYCKDLLLFNLTKPALPQVTLSFEPREIFGKPPSPRGYHVTLLADSRLFLFGGFNGLAPIDEVLNLDLAAAAYLPQVTHFELHLPE
ncbi:galactose oxidase [Mycena amicta]|nr:galactose oxidase [Mycena amicta]